MRKIILHPPQRSESPPLASLQELPEEHLGVLVDIRGGQGDGIPIKFENIFGACLLVIVIARLTACAGESDGVV